MFLFSPKKCYTDIPTITLLLWKSGSQTLEYKLEGRINPVLWISVSPLRYHILFLLFHILISHKKSTLNFIEKLNISCSCVCVCEREGVCVCVREGVCVL